MAQQSSRSCPKCDTPLAPGQRFCSNCGSIVEPAAYQPTELTPNSAGSLPEMGTYQETPPPPPPDSYASPPMQGSLPPQMGYQPPAYAQAPKDSSKKVIGQIGCGVLAIILLALALCGVGGFFVYRSVTSTANKVSQAVSTTGSTVGNNSSSSSSDATPTFAPPTTSTVNASVKYADVDITVVDVKQASGFVDDTSSSSTAGVLRIDLKENNKTARSSNYYYGSMVRLLLADGTSVTPSNTQDTTGPAAAVTRTNWIDFPVASSLDASKLTLQLGTADEEQIAIPLTNNPDLGKYQPKTVTVNKSAQYIGTSWTLLSATAQLSGDNQQAPKGQIYVIVTLKIDNNSTQSFGGYYGDYIRLQTGDTKATPNTDSTIPLSAAPGQTNQTGTALFLVPQGSTSFNFLLLAAASTGATQQASIPFQIG